MAFGDNLKLLMKNHKISGEELGELVGKKKSAISFWVNNKTEPSISEIIAIKKRFNVSYEDLFENELEISNSLNFSNKVSETEPQYFPNPDKEEKIIIQKETIYMERLCAATAGVCFFEQLQKANEEIAKLKQEVETLRHTEGLKE